MKRGPIIREQEREIRLKGGVILRWRIEGAERGGDGGRNGAKQVSKVLPTSAGRLYLGSERAGRNSLIKDNQPCILNRSISKTLHASLFSF